MDPHDVAGPEGSSRGANSPVPPGVLAAWPRELRVEANCVLGRLPLASCGIEGAPMTRLAILLVALVLAAGCGDAKPKLSADAYYKEASEAYSKRNYDVAAAQYKEL